MTQRGWGEKCLSDYDEDSGDVCIANGRHLLASRATMEKVFQGVSRGFLLALRQGTLAQATIAIKSDLTDVAGFAGGHIIGNAALFAREEWLTLPFLEAPFVSGRNTSAVTRFVVPPAERVEQPLTPSCRSLAASRETTSAMAAMRA